MSKSMPILIVLPREAFGVVFTGRNWAFLRPFVLVCKHVGLQILEHAPTLWQGTHALFACLVIHIVAATALAARARVLRLEGSD
jgi:hypothetical protein